MSLSPTFLLKGSILYDSRLHAEHLLQPEAQVIAGEMAESVSVRILFSGHGSSAVTDVLGFFNQSGALIRYRAPDTYPHLFRQWLRAPYMLLHYPALVHRVPFTTTRLLQAAIIATWPVLASACLVAWLAASSGIVQMRAVLTAGSFGAAVFIGSLLIHELAHAVVILRQVVNVDIIYAPLHLKMLHRRQPPSIEAYSALAGPIAGSLVCLMAGLAGMFAGKPGMLWVCLVIASFHICSLLPWYGDGASLKGAMRGAQQ
ncbi:MAG TPA: hypothetical protein VIR03_00125 [Candidatus Saccharimonadales bacterium]